MVLWYISKKKWKIRKLTQNCPSESVKNQSCTALFERKSALFSSESALFQKKSALKKRCFSADSYLWNFSFSALFRAEPALFRDFKVMSSAETNLKLFWIRADQLWKSETSTRVSSLDSCSSLSFPQSSTSFSISWSSSRYTF